MHSKTTKSRLQNFGKHAQKQSKATSEDVPLPQTSDLPPAGCTTSQATNSIPQESYAISLDNQEQPIYLLGILDGVEEEGLPDLADSLSEMGDSDVDSEDGEFAYMFEENEDMEIQDFSELETFTKVLSEAQRIAVEAENERLKDHSRPTQYLRNSARTKRRQRAFQKDLAKKGFPSVLEWLKKSKPAASTSTQETISVSSEDSEDETQSSESDNEMVDSHYLVQDMSDFPTNSVEFHQEDSMSVHDQDATYLKDPAADAQKKIAELLEQLRNGQKPTDDTPPTESDQVLDQMNYTNIPKLRRACAALTVKSKDKKLDVLFRTRITGMVGTLNLYLDSQLSYSWREASLIAAKAQGKGVTHARNLRTWIHRYLGTSKLPVHSYGRLKGSILDDEDFSHLIQVHLTAIAKGGYIRAQDIVDYMQSTEMQQKLDKMGAKKKTISLRTAQCWLHKMGWRYGRKRNGMYVDGQEREDVVEYREEFIEQWKSYNKRMYSYSNNGEKFTNLQGFPVPPGQAFRLILVTHDESTFYETDRRKSVWSHKTDKAVPVKKGKGVSLMASDFLTVEWGRLQSEDGTEAARILFKAGKNRDGYFTSDDLIAQVDHAIDIFEGRTNGLATGLFFLTMHPAIRSVQMMPFLHVKCQNFPQKTGLIEKVVHMQSFYFDDDHPEMPGYFKGMEQIIRERGLYANRSARFIAAYDLGLSGAEAAWVNKKYHGHRTLPPIWIAYLEDLAALGAKPIDYPALPSRARPKLQDAEKENMWRRRWDIGVSYPAWRLSYGEITVDGVHESKGGTMMGGGGNVVKTGTGD
ncbi:hypothetical protein D9619_010553 [Psilocybe cf. subviscida]|uniref:Uncharacterized protein n=1 Tax=Psilocybe cf. subviscida TaxID=2480587 RepID=A0A8H5ASM7_9AGAR|nr:hypothetical protein D9619_010553 [Psilocybe cf. subviscida]